MAPPTRPIAALLCLWLLAPDARARADAPPRDEPEPKVGWATVGGALTAIVPLAIGSSIIASTEDVGRRRAGSVTIAAGLALAPIVSHLAAREWTRAAIFGAIPVACFAGMVALLEVQPTADVYGTRSGRLTYGLVLSFGVLSAGLGIIDTLGAARRTAERRPRLLIRSPP